MNLFSSFDDFYKSLSSDGVFFFWIVIFLLCFLLFLTVILVIKNRKLTILLEEEKNEIAGKRLEEIPTAESEKIEESIADVNVLPEQREEQTTFIDNDKEVATKEENTKDNDEEIGPYKKNVLREMNARMQTSPIHIDKNRNNVVHNSNLCQREEFISPLEEMEDAYEVNDNMKFASEIVNRMEEEVKPSNIELTDYEKKQEEEAIISYDELLKVKDKIYNITEDEETDEFIDELKSFRLDL